MGCGIGGRAREKDFGAARDGFVGVADCGGDVFQHGRAAVTGI